MAEETEGRGSGIREGVREIGRDMSPRKAEEKLEEAVDRNPLLQHLLSWEVVLRALAVAAVVTLIVLLLLSAKIAAVALVLTFGAAWIGFGMRRYETRRQTRPASSEATSSGE